MRDSQLVYYKDDKEYKPKDIISTSDIMAVAMLTDQNKPNHFAFFTPSKNYHMRADSTQDAEQWVEKLKESLELASQKVLSSSFKRLGTLSETAKTFGGSFQPPSIKPSNTNRHSVNMGKPSTALGTSFPKRHTINLSANPSLLSQVQQQNEHISNTSKLTPPPSKRSLDISASLAKSMESSGTSRTSYGGANSLFSGGAEETGPSSCPSDHGSPMVQSNLEDTKSSPAAADAQAHRREKSELSLMGHVAEDGDREMPLTAAKGEETILETGHLLRLKKRYKHWTDQWVVLTNERLLFYKNEKSKSVVKEIEIENLIDVVEMDAMSKSKQYCMQLITPEKRMRFCAPSEEDLIRWLAAIKAVIDASPNTASIAYDQIEEE